MRVGWYTQIPGEPKISTKPVIVITAKECPVVDDVKLPLQWRQRTVAAIRKQREAEFEYSPIVEVTSMSRCLYTEGRHSGSKKVIKIQTRYAGVSGGTGTNAARQHI